MIPAWFEGGYSHIWHPYTQMQVALPPLPVVGAEGSTLILADGQRLLDGIASWWSVCHGYQHPHLIAAIQTQASQLSHVMFAGLAHEPAYRLAERLAGLTKLERVFFSDSGSVAVEVAMKMAVQYWRNRGEKHRTKFLSFRRCYHGDTMGAMSLSDPERSLHMVYNGYIPKQYVWDIPCDEYSFNEFDALLSDIRKTTAAVIIEPLIQGAGGMVPHTADILAEIYRLCRKHDILFIADEIATGFYRTGMLFACQEAGITPDIMCLGKALSGGMLPLAATLASHEVFQAFLSEDRDKALMHGPTFMANPILCAVANASLDLFEQHPYALWVERIEQQLWQGLKPLQRFSTVKDIRVKGAIGVVELKELTSARADWMKQAFIAEGIWLRPFANMIYLMPALTMTETELAQLIQAIETILCKWGREP